MLYQYKRDLSKVIDGDRIFYGEGRGETGVCLHIPLRNHVAGGAPNEDHALMVELCNNLIRYLLYKRPVKGPEAWDYDGEKAGELYTVCGDNPTTSGIVIVDKNYDGGMKLQVVLDKTFGANEMSIRWKNGMVGDEFLLKDYLEYLKQALATGELASEQD
ncbi:hypothetical protein FJY68_07150 [candidate division WOR-3 bacterium]|uniref:Uncharacterized protein n=1 Tax=candidate division WOR-3 bacterium TaxID=2052148 RepID=A0A937XIC5_UNCW3|nr:hypothetical protein [candidate division WOR-3 bacterium]